MQFQTAAVVQPKGRLGAPLDGRDVVVFPFHVAVLHEIVELEMPSLTDVCVWRQELIHPVADAAARELEQRAGIQPRIHDVEPYCLTCFEVVDLPWDGAPRRKALEILALPSELGRAGLSSRAAALATEEQFLYRQDRHQDLVNFGGEDWAGFASWSAVSFEVSPDDSEFARDVIELEIQLQALWCYCNCAEALGSLRSKDYGAVFLRRSARRLSKPNATEHISRRLMREALQKTSRIEDMIEVAIENLASEEQT